jgi:PHD-finger
VSGICGIDEDDGFTIFCERCSVWQHGACVGIRDAEDAPEHYLCDECNPRPLDVQKAVRLQTKRQEAEQNSHKPRRRASHHPKTKLNQNSTLGPPPNLQPPNNRKEKQTSPPRRTEGKKPRATGRGQSVSQVETVVQEDVDVVVHDEDANMPIWPKAEDFDYRDQSEVPPALALSLDQQLQHLENMRLDGCYSLF